MRSAICTLFEGHYHFGLAALVNSLYANGFKGEIYAGYRGAAPSWAADAVHNSTLNWENSTTLTFHNDIHLHLLPLKTTHHLTNYKPDFMLELWKGVAKDCEILYYLDPDIVLCKNWGIMEEWVNSGVALCEDINSPLSKNHPRRTAWRTYFKKYGVTLSYKGSLYVNGGCVGLKKSDIGFLNVWQDLQLHMSHEIGGLEYAGITTFYNGKQMTPQTNMFFAPFSKTDQDALNASIEAWDGEVSIVGAEGMGFKSANTILAHALGLPKPWMKAYIKFALKGRYPTVADKNFWNYVEQPIRLYPAGVVKKRRLQLSIASAIGRIYRNT